MDFALVIENQPATLIEAKLSETAISPSLRYLHRKYGIPAVQVVRYLRQEQMVDGLNRDGH